MGGSKIQFSPFLKSNIQFRPRSTTLIHSVSNPLHSRTPQIQFRLNLPSGPTPAQQLRIATYSATRRRQSVLTSYASPLPSVVRSNPLANAKRAMAPRCHRPLSSHYRPHRVADVYQQPRPFQLIAPTACPALSGLHNAPKTHLRQRTRPPPTPFSRIASIEETNRGMFLPREVWATFRPDTQSDPNADACPTVSKTTSVTSVVP